MLNGKEYLENSLEIKPTFKTKHPSIHFQNKDLKNPVEFNKSFLFVLDDSMLTYSSVSWMKINPS